MRRRLGTFHATVVAYVALLIALGGTGYAATVVFVSTWLVISAANLWVGVSKAGYALSDELPILGSVLD